MSLKDFSAQDHVAITTLGLEFATAEILGVGFGFWLDKKYNSSPWFLVAGAVNSVSLLTSAVPVLLLSVWMKVTC